MEEYKDFIIGMVLILVAFTVPFKMYRNERKKRLRAEGQLPPYTDKELWKYCKKGFDCNGCRKPTPLDFEYYYECEAMELKYKEMVSNCCESCGKELDKKG